MNIYRYMLLCLLLGICSCDNTDDSEIFDVPADERMTEQLLSYKNELTTAGDGWKTTFFPDTTHTGGWSFVMKFDQQNGVQMIGDVLENPEVENGVYGLLSSQGPVLSFKSYLPITELSNPSSSHPQARYGSNDFVFIGEQENGDITLKSKRNNSELILKKASEEDWEDIKLNMETEAAFIGSPTSSVYRFFTIGNGTDSLVYEVVYDKYYRQMTLTNADEAVVQSIDRGVAFTKDSLLMHSPVNYQGSAIGQMFYEEDEDRFIGVNGDVTAKLYYSSIPYNLGNDVADIHLTKNMFSYRDDTLEDTPYTSPNFVNIYNNINEKMTGGRILWRIEIQFMTEDEGRVRYRYRVGETNYSGYHYFTYHVEDNKMVLTENIDEDEFPDGWSGTNSAVISALEDLDTLLFSPEGIFVKKLSETYTYTNVVYTFTSAKDPSVRFPTYSVLNTF
ncbi:DUF4302 domain-containing protein [Sinomicrobium sp.]